MRQQGLSDVTDSLAMVRATTNPGVRLLGYLLTMVVPRRTIHQIYEDTPWHSYGPKRLRGPRDRGGRVRRGDRQKATVAYRSIPKGKACTAKAIRVVADEMLARIEAFSVITRTEAA